jgi:hypothetical protein
LSLKLADSDDPAGHNAAAIVYAEKIVAARERDIEVIPGTVGEICSRAREEFLPAIENKVTRKWRERHLDALQAKFGSRRYARNVFEASRDTSGTFLRAMDVQRHIFDGKKTRPVGVNREVRTWELVFQFARAPMGLTEYNPCSGLTENKETHRKVVPQDGSIFKLYRELDPPGRFMVGMIRYYGRRKVELLGLEPSSGKEDGIHLRRGKDAESKTIIIKWDTRNRRMWERVLRWRQEVIRPTKPNKRGKVKKPPKVVSTMLLINRRGRAYTETGFNSARKRAMRRAGLSVVIGEQEVRGKTVKKYRNAFTFHDMRKSRAEDNLTPAQAQNVLAHDDPRTTNVKYRVGAIVVDLNEEVKAKRKAR